jgi:glycosyltransferase involved in cell wall biosynthesis
VARILQVCNTDFYLSKLLAPLVNAPVARGHAVECICEGGDADRRLLDPAVPVHPFLFPRGAAPLEFGRAIIEDYLGACDAFVLPSYREGLPRALLEAMAVELPVLATNIRGCREVVKDGESGHLSEPRDIAALARLLERLRDSPELRETLGRRGRALIVAEFDERQYVSRQVGAIERLLGAARAAPATP